MGGCEERGGGRWEIGGGRSTVRRRRSTWIHIRRTCLQVNFNSKIWSNSCFRCFALDLNIRTTWTRPSRTWYSCALRSYLWTIRWLDCVLGEAERLKV